MPTKLKLALIIGLAYLILPFGASASVGEINSNIPGAERITVTNDGGLAVYSSAGTLLSGFPLWADGVFVSNPLISNFDGTTGNEIAIVERRANAEYFLHLYDSTGTEISSTILSGFDEDLSPVTLYNNTTKKYNVIYSNANGDVFEVSFNNNTWSNNLIITGSGTKAVLSTNNSKDLIYYVPKEGTQIITYKKTDIWNLLNTIETNVATRGSVFADDNDQLWFLSSNKLYSYSTAGILTTGFPINLRLWGTDLIVADIDKNNPGLEVGVQLSDNSVDLYNYEGGIIKTKLVKEKFSIWQALTLEKDQGFFSYNFNNNLTIKSGSILDTTSILNPISGPLFKNSINFTSNTVEILPKTEASIFVSDENNNEITSGQSITLGSYNKGEAIKDTIIIKNLGEEDLIINSASLTNSEGQNCGSINPTLTSISPSSTQTVTLILQPKKFGDQQCNLNIISNGVNNNNFSITYSFFIDDKYIYYFTGEADTIEGWKQYGTSTTINLVFDEERQSNVASFTGPTGYVGAFLYDQNGNYWGNDTDRYFGLDFKFNERFFISVYVSTNDGKTRYIQYSPDQTTGKVDWIVTGVKLDTNYQDGNWHKLTRDLQADLNKGFPGETITQIHYLLVRGIGSVDAVKMWNEANLGNVQGKITDTNGTALVGAKITAYPGNFNAVSDASGNYEFEGLTSGDYQLTAELMDYIFNPATFNITVGTSTITQDFTATKNMTPTVYFTGETGTIEGWLPYNSNSTISLVFDEEKQSNVASFTGPSGYVGAFLYDQSGATWNNSRDKYLDLNFKFNENFYISAYVSTNMGSRYIQYSPAQTTGLVDWIITGVKLDKSYQDGNWHRLTRNLQADLNLGFPGETITKIHYLLVRGIGQMDNVRTWKEMDLGNVGGQITDSNGQALYGVKITLSPSNVSTVSDVAGNYQFDGLIVGEYQLKAELTDYLFNPETAAVNIIANSSQAQNFTATKNILPTIYFTGNSTTTEGWVPQTVSSTATLVFDEDTQSNVIELDGPYGGQSFLYTPEKVYWNNTTDKFLDVDLKYSGNFFFRIYVSTNVGDRYIRYSPTEVTGQIDWINTGVKLDAQYTDGTWHNLTRDLQADLNLGFPGETITKIHYIIVKGAGRIDNVKMWKEIPEKGLTPITMPLKVLLEMPLKEVVPEVPIVAPVEIPVVLPIETPEEVPVETTAEIPPTEVLPEEPAATEQTTPDPRTISENIE